MTLGRHAPVALALTAALALPLLLAGAGQSFYLGFASRLMIYAIAASSLNLLIGYGGLLSFGHAAFVGIGAYAASILLAEGITSAWLGWAAAISGAALGAAAIGAVSLRTKGVYFIMITLAFAQMLYFLAHSLKAYGGDEGLSLAARPALGFGLDLGDEIVFYYTVLVALGGTLYALHRVLGSRFGRVIVAMRENAIRAAAIGFPVYRYQLACFVVAGALGGLAGALLASHGKYVNPNLLHWSASGTLMIMVILGGVGHLWGGVIGAALLLGLEHLIADYPLPWLAALAPNYPQHANLGVGLVLLAIVLFAPRGVAGLFSGSRRG